MSDSESRVTIIASSIIALLIVAAIFDEFSTRKLSILFFFIFWVPMLIVHELGHALMAKALGWRVREIVIGFGRTIWQRQIGETRLAVKLAPLEGYVLPAPSDRERMRLKSSLIYAAGPGAEILILGVAIAMFGWETVFNDSDDVALIALQSLAVVIVLGAGFNLLPFRTDGAVSDGLGIISSPFMSDEEIELRLLTFETREFGRLLDRGLTRQAVGLANAIGSRFPNNAWLTLLEIRARSADGQLDTARELMRAELAKSGESGILEKELLKIQAQIELAADDPDYLTLDLAVQKALGIMPDAPDLVATKGASLVQRGQFQEGGNMLAEAWRSNDGTADDPMMLAYLSIAARGMRDHEAQAHFLDAFAATNHSVLLQRKLESLT
jgi:hypothetical protein